METLTLKRRLLPSVECAVLDSYEDAGTKAVLLLSLSAPFAGTHLIRVSLKNGEPSGAQVWSPLDVLGTAARVFGEWRDARRVANPDSPYWDSIRDRFTRALETRHPKFTAADVAEQTTVIREAS